MPTTAAIATTAVGAGASIYSANQQKSAINDASSLAEDVYAQQAANLSGLELGDFKNYEYFDIFDYAQKATKFNTQRIPYATNNAIALAGTANNLATLSNQAITNDVESAVAALFGGPDALNAQRSASNAAINQWLSGQVSQSTQDQLARSSLASGATDLGPGAVSDLYTGYLGLTQEQVIGQGMSAYQSLYSMYRQALPLTTGPQMLGTLGQIQSSLLPYLTISPADAIQAEEYNRLNEANSSIQAAALQYQADYNQVIGQNMILGNMAQSSAQASYGTAGANSSMANGIASSVASGLGMYVGATSKTKTVT